MGIKLKNLTSLKNTPLGPHLRAKLLRGELKSSGYLLGEDFGITEAK